MTHVLAWTSVISGTEISLASIADPDWIIHGKLLSIEGRYAEVALDAVNEPVKSALSPGSLVRFQTPETLYLGEIQASSTENIRVCIEHSVDLEKAGAIRRLWNADGSS